MATPSAADENSPSEQESADDENSPSEQESQDAYSRWLQTLSEPELDLLISLKELAVTRAAHLDLSQRFHLRTVHALGIVLLEHFKDRLKQNSGGLHGLALLRDPDPSQVQAMSNVVDEKRKQLQHGLGEDSTSSSSKKRKKDTEMERLI